ncbi:MAG: amino acid ABC transporter permease [Nocardioidaceae bacterium]
MSLFGQDLLPGSDGRNVPVVRVKHYLRWVIAFCLVVVFAWLTKVVVTSPNIFWSEVWWYLFEYDIWHGIGITLALTVLATIIGLAIGVILAVMKLSSNPVASGLSTLYIWFFRGTPVLVQLIFWYNLAFLFPRIGWGPLSWKTNDVMTGFTAALLGLGLNLAAYSAEVFRAGIQSVDVGQTEAAMSIGMRRLQMLRVIVLPQALRVVIPPIGNEGISMLKNTSLVYVVAGADLMTQASQIYKINNEVIELLIVASIWYMVMTALATIGQSMLEARFGTGPRVGFGRKLVANLRIGRRGKPALGQGVDGG